MERQFFLVFSLFLILKYAKLYRSGMFSLIRGWNSEDQCSEFNNFEANLCPKEESKTGEEICDSPTCVIVSLSLATTAWIRNAKFRLKQVEIDNHLFQQNLCSAK